MAVSVTYEDYLNDLIKIIKDPDNDDLKGGGYVHAVKHAKEMGVHLNGDRPIELLERVRPREDPEITAYRLQSYEPTTKSRADKGVSLTSKIFHPKLSAVKPADNKQGQQLYEYAMVEYPEYNSVFSYLADYLLKKTLTDANALLVVEPGKIPYRQDGEDLIVDQTKQVMPVVNCYPSKDVYFFEDGIAIIFLYMEEENEGGVKVKYYYYKAVDQENITEFRLYTTNGQTYAYDELSSYNHKFNITPAWRTGGAYDQHHKGMFESFFYPAVPHWNKAINAESDLDGAFITSIHPWRWETAEECEFVERSETGPGYPCMNGWIVNLEKKDTHICPSCNGAGRMSRRGPFGVSLVSKDKLSDPQGNQLANPPGGYIPVDTAPTELLDQRVDKLEKKGFSALAMDIINEIGENQSGVAKEYDRTELHDFLGRVSTLFFDKHLKNIFYFFARYMFFNATPDQIKTYEPTVIKPNDFDILTTSELMDQLKTSKDSGVNPVYLRAKDLEVINKEFQNMPEVLKFMNLCVMLDPLAEISRTDIAQMVLDKSITQITAIIHDNIQPFVRRALVEDPQFGDKEYMEQMEVIEGYAAETAEAINEESKVKIDMMAFEQQNLTPPDPNTDPNEPKDDAE